ncbi:MAG: 23S rRNA (guanosine(2251)-2'-O)-methyltransferase RlmB [Candidatus Omnitrophica bacterium]|nr:23S rRNA (guanosine(2251)-2'-O)-methyltransferase RlmB [Candidatus Omnitrophota bacterium]
MKLFGKNSVIERIKSNPKSIRTIYVQTDHADASYIRKKAKKWGIAVYGVAQSKILKMTRNLNSQGVVADVEDFQYTEYSDLLDQALKKKLSLLFLDNLKDPQNLGAIIRSVACLGDFGIVLPKKESVSITEAVFRVASGGDNYVSVSRVSNLSNAISLAKKQGFWIAGSVVEGGEDLSEQSLPFPIGLVIGSEQRGIRDVIRKQIDVSVTIPMKHERLSFNAAQATAILCYEITKQKNKKDC